MSLVVSVQHRYLIMWTFSTWLLMVVMAQALSSPFHSLGLARYLVSCFLLLHFGDALPSPYVHHCGSPTCYSPWYSWCGILSLMFLDLPCYLSHSPLLFNLMFYCFYYLLQCWLPEKQQGCCFWVIVLRTTIKNIICEYFLARMLSLLALIEI